MCMRYIKFYILMNTNNKQLPREKEEEKRKELKSIINC